MLGSITEPYIIQTKLFDIEPDTRINICWYEKKNNKMPLGTFHDDKM